jgi:hypothetical protein
MYAAPLDNKETLQHRIMAVHQTIRNYPGISEKMRPSMMRRVEACTISHGGHFHFIYFKLTLPPINHKINVLGHMLVWTVFLVLVCGSSAQILCAPFSYTQYILKEFDLEVTLEKSKFILISLHQNTERFTT